MQLVRKGDLREALAATVRRPISVSNSQAVIVITADYARTQKMYGEEAKGFVDIEVGCVCQNIHLQCESLRLGTVALGGFDVKAAHAILGDVPVPVLMMPVGAKKK